MTPRSLGLDAEGWMLWHRVCQGGGCVGPLVQPTLAIVMDELEPQLFSLAKKAAAFFKISFLMRSESQ
jgi:hypothetical protein